MLTGIEKFVLPFFLKVGENKILTVIRNGLTLTIPFTIAGSFFSLSVIFPSKLGQTLLLQLPEN